jgi:hypothetical protein
MPIATGVKTLFSAKNAQINVDSTFPAQKIRSGFRGVLAAKYVESLASREKH